MTINLVTVKNPKTKESVTYHIDRYFHPNLVKIKRTLYRKDKDYVFLVDGGEGRGKSTLAIQIGKFIDPTLDLSRITFNAEEFRKAILGASKGNVVIFDEAFTGLSSRSTISKINKMLVSLMMQMRQKNLFVIIVLPSFFELDRYAAIFRSRALANCYEVQGKRGYYRVWNENKKKFLYLQGKQAYNYSAVKPSVHGRFTGKFVLSNDPEVERLYRQKKLQALEASTDTDGAKPLSPYHLRLNLQKRIAVVVLADLLYELGQRELFPYYKKVSKKWTYVTIADAFRSNSVDITSSAVGTAVELARQEGIKSLAWGEMMQNKTSNGQNTSDVTNKKALKDTLSFNEAAKAFRDSGQGYKVRSSGAGKEIKRVGEDVLK